MAEEEVANILEERLRRLRREVMRTALGMELAPALAYPAREPTKKSLSLVDWLFAAAFDGLERAVSRVVRRLFP